MEGCGLGETEPGGQASILYGSSHQCMNVSYWVNEKLQTNV